MKARQARLAALFYVLMTVLAGPAQAQNAPLGSGGEHHLGMTLIAETDRPRAGERVTLALRSVPDAGWHGYWQNPGDAGLAPKLTWTLPAGVTADALRYPVPGRLLVAGLMNYVYDRPFAPLVELMVPAGLPAGTPLSIRVKVDYLVCSATICVPESQTLALNLTVGTAPVVPNATFDTWRRALPRPLGSVARFAVAGDKLRLAIPFPAAAGADGAYFYPLTNGAIDYAAPQTVSRDGDTLIVATKAGTGKPSELSGVLAAGGQGFIVRAVPGAVAVTDAAGGVATTALLAFLGAVVGGLILNVMPCVFPILSLKALGLARSAQSEAHARSEALAYTAGVVAVCVALGALLLGLRAGGAGVGWAFQLTDPRVILLLLLLAAGIAFNLAGLFELPAPALANRWAANGKGGAFATGALAAFVATPCSGPFMGAALGAALVLPTAAALLVFAGLGLGIALPFLALGFVPALRRRLPKPGAWMEAFRRLLALPMFVTVVALAWLLGRLAGVNAMALALLVLTGFAVVLWAVGRRQARGGGFGAVAAVMLAVIALSGTWLVGTSRLPAAAASTVAGTEPFTETRLASLRAEGRPVFAYFTADWCLSCKVNEAAAIDTAAVHTAFAKAGVVTLVGDWTDGDPALGRFIDAHNRAGVPLYLWYPSGAAEPVVLPQVLTPGTLTALVPPAKS